MKVPSAAHGSPRTQNLSLYAAALIAPNFTAGVCVVYCTLAIKLQRRALSLTSLLSIAEGYNTFSRWSSIRLLRTEWQRRHRFRYVG